MQVIQYYLQKGHRLEDLLNLTVVELAFYRASMEITIEDETQRIMTLIETMFGGN